MRTLALDCSQTGLCLAVLQDDKILASLSLVQTEPQSAILLRRIDEILKASRTKLDDIERVLYCRGPGSFTSLRIGLATLMGLFLPAAHKIEYVETSSLLFRCLALQKSDEDVQVIMKAGRNRAYVGELSGDAFSEKVKTLETPLILEDPQNPQAFIKVLKNPIYHQKRAFTEAQIEYLMAPDIG